LDLEADSKKYGDWAWIWLKLALVFRNFKCDEFEEDFSWDLFQDIQAFCHVLFDFG
jgi:hypothetical protein